MAFNVATRLFVLLFTILIAGVFSVLGAGARLVTALCIIVLGLAPVTFIGLYLRTPSPTSRSSEPDASGTVLPD